VQLSSLYQILPASGQNILNSKIAFFNSNVVKAEVEVTFVICNSIVATFQKWKQIGEINFNSRLCAMCYI
jgi:hypothetical protein